MKLTISNKTDPVKTLKETWKDLVNEDKSEMNPSG